MHRRTRVALAGVATLALAGAPAAMAQTWSVEVEDAVYIGGEPWTGPAGARIAFNSPFGSGTARVGLTLAGRYLGSTGLFGMGNRGSWTFPSLADGAYTARVDLESERRCSGGMCSWQTSWRSGNFKVDRTPPSAPSINADPATPRTSHQPIEWWPASDTGAGVTAYELRVDDVPQPRVGTGECAYTCGADVAPTLLPNGQHQLSVRAFDALGNATDSATVGVTVADAPTVQLVSPPRFVIVGRSATITARGSIPNGTPLTYAWDTNGDGTYETDTGEVPSVRITPAADVTLGVQVSAGLDQTATASAPIDVRKTPPSDEPGVTINDGDRFSRDPQVTLSLSWPDGASGMRIATDGSFKGATTEPIAPTATITLKADENSLLPHVVYVRFVGAGIDARETYTDDIILDTTPPVIQQATAAPISAKALRVSTRVRDAVSGPKRLQVARSAGAQGTTVAYAPSVRAPVKGAKVAVRVADAAGNWSKWKTVAARRG